MAGHLDVLVAQIRALEYKQVLDMGRTHTRILDHWSNAKSDRVVLIGERYLHIIERHPELVGREADLIRTVLDPDFIHRNRNDPQVVILYRGLNDYEILRVSLWVTDESRFQNSIHSARLARERELLVGMIQGREIWRKG